MPYNQELRIAKQAAEKAGEIQLSHRHKLLHIENKSDSSPVTQVDKLCEETIRDLLREAFSRRRVFRGRDGLRCRAPAAENGSSTRSTERDPIFDGIPTYSALIALEDGSDLVVGCMNLPAMNETYWASKGDGAFLNGAAIHVSKASRLAEIMGSGFGYIEKNGTPCAAQLLSAMKSWGYSYGFMDAYTYGCIAAGKIDASVNLLDKPWDCAAAAAIIEEAGGRFSDISGAHTIYSGSCVLSNGVVHDIVLEYFRDSH
jgi:histidinol-phosphatase